MLNNRHACEFLYNAGVTDNHQDLQLFRAVAERLSSEDRAGFGDPGFQARVEEFRSGLRRMASALGLDPDAPAAIDEAATG